MDNNFGQLQEGKARSREFLHAAINKDPQIMTRRGVETLVLAPIDERRRLQRASRPSSTIGALLARAIDSQERFRKGS